MATHDYNIANADGATVRADINSVLEAVATNNSSSTAPPVTFPYMFWFDTSVTPGKLKQRNGANTAWIDFIDDSEVTTSTGTQALAGAMDDRLNITDGVIAVDNTTERDALSVSDQQQVFVKDDALYKWDSGTTSWIKQDSSNYSVDSGTGSGETLTVALNSRTQTVDDYSEVRALDDNTDTAVVKGRSSSGDGGEGVFFRDDTDTSSSDNDSTVMVATGLARWKRSYNGTLDARWFGATGDGSTDDQAAIQTALNEAESKTRGGKVWLPSPSDAYLISDGLIVPMNVHLIGGTDRTHIRADAATFPVGKYMIQMGRDNGPDFGVGIQGLHLDCNGVDDSRGVEIPALQENSFLKEITVTNCQWNCIRVYNGVNASPQNFLMQGLWLILDPSITESGSRHINIQGAGGPILIQRLSTVFKNVTPGTVPGVSVDLNAQVTIDTWNAEAGLDGTSFNARVSSNLASIRNMRSRGDNTGIQVQSGAVGGVFQNIISPDQSTGITIDDNINTVDVTGAVTHYAT